MNTLIKIALSTGLPILAVALMFTAALAQETPTQPRQQPSASTSLTTAPNDKTPVPVAHRSAEALVVKEKPGGKAFSTPEAAAEAFCEAVRKNDNTVLLGILGPEGKDLIEWSKEPTDGVQEQRHEFVQKWDRMHRLVHEPDNTVQVYVGPENWPMPIPIVQYSGSWYFDANLGRQEVLYRRVGRNEINALDVCRELIDAEKEYYGIAHKFTNKFDSSANSRDGLYWKMTDTTARSPIGPYLAQAGVTDSIQDHRPFHGYYYRIVLHDGGSNNFAVVAFPAEYRSSGVMTFIINENGDAYEKDLGQATASSAIQITGAPDATWKKVQ